MRKNKSGAQIDANQYGAFVVKFLWWPLIISILFSIILTIGLNILI